MSSKYNWQPLTSLASASNQALQQKANSISNYHYLLPTKMADADENASETITLRVKDQTGDEMFFKVKKNTKMQVSCLS